MLLKCKLSNSRDASAACHQDAPAQSLRTRAVTPVGWDVHGRAPGAGVPGGALGKCCPAQMLDLN